MSDERPLICGFLKVRNEVIREGNIHRALDNLAAFCDVIVACDDASNDETDAVLAVHPKVKVLLRVPREEQDFRNELAVKQAMLQEVHKLQPYFVWWHDADEELEPSGVQGVRAMCESLKAGGPPAWRFVYKQLWRSADWYRTDSGFGDGAFIKLWRWTPTLAFDVRYGTHGAQFPRQIAEALHLVPTAPWVVIHWGNYGKNLVWKCIQYHGGLGGVDRHLNFEHGDYLPLREPVNEPMPVPFTTVQKGHILGMQGLRKTPGWFSVLVPTYNRFQNKMLPRALQSLQDQTYPYWIALVLDDGSTDGTESKIREWTEADPRIFYCRYPQNRGGVAMNEIGTNLAIEFTEYWTRLGSDDFFDLTKLELDAWAFSQGADAVYGPYQVLRSGSRGEVCNPPVLPSVAQAALFNGVFAASWANVAIRSSALARVREQWGRFADPRLRNMEDFLVNARVGQVTDGFHFRGVVDGQRVYVKVDADAHALTQGDLVGFLASGRATPDAVWNIGIDGASSNMGVTARDDALTREILAEDRSRGVSLPAVKPKADIRRVSVAEGPVREFTWKPQKYGYEPPQSTRAFWRCAGGFPKDKEGAYPGHTEAHQFDLHTNEDVLEYGCGGGADTLSWLRRQNRVVAVDIVPENVLITRQAIADASGAGDAIVLTHTTPLPFSDSRFDVVSSHGVVHHIHPPAHAELLKEFFRVLRPGGMCYLMLYTEYLWEHHWMEMQAFIQNHGISKEEAFGWCTDGRGCPYARAYTEEQGQQFLESAGFVLECVVDYNTKFFRTFQARRP